LAQEVAQLGGDLGRLPLEAPMGEPDDSIASDLHRCVASAVVLESGAVPMEFEAVGLDHQLLLWPEGVHLAAQDDLVRPGDWQFVLAAERQDRILEGGATRFARILEKAMKRFEPPSSIATSTNAFQLGHLQEAHPVRLVESPLELLLIDHFGEIEEGAGDRGDRDRVDDGIFVPLDSAFVNGDTLSLPTSRRRDFDGLALRNAPQRGCASVAEYRSLTAYEDSGDPSPALGQTLAAETIDLPMQSVQTPRFQSVPNRPRP
jgi:hypothetical protein